MNDVDQQGGQFFAADGGVDDIRYDDEAELPAHLIALPGGPWALWRWVALRGTGFPSAQVLRLAAPACGCAADRYIQAEDLMRQARDVLSSRFLAALEARRNALDDGDEEQRPARLHAIHALKNWGIRNMKPGRTPEPLDAAFPESVSVEEYRAVVAARDVAYAQFCGAFEQATADISQVLREVAGDERFREAVVWQNRLGFHKGVDALRHAPPGRTSKQRQREELVAMYVQRYCVKNDSIGFFGPVGWARIEPWADSLVVQPNRRFLAARTVYFDEWGIDVLAKKLAENRALQPWFAPRRLPFLYVEGTKLYLLAEEPTVISVAQAALLRVCDGTRTAKEIAGEVLRDASNGLKDVQAVYTLLRFMRDQGLITWTFEIPLELRPERTLQRLLDRIEDADLRQQAYVALNELEAARTMVAEAAGDAERLDQALGHLEAVFSRLTGVEATRSPGQMYAGRTLVYEDCRRNVDVEIGAEVLESLGPPLSLLLTSARWLTYHVAMRYREMFRDLYQDLVGETGKTSVSMIGFWRRVQGSLEDSQVQVIGALVEVFQTYWAEVFQFPAGACAVSYTSAEIQAQVLERFAAPRSGWRSIPYHSPDVMIAAESVDAIQRGDYQLVLGELHVAMNTLGIACFMGQHPAQHELFLALELDQVGPRVMPMIPRTWSRMTSRTRNALVSPHDYRLVFDPDTPGVPKSRMIAIGELFIEEGVGGLIARTYDRRVQFELDEVFAVLLASLTANSFHILRPAVHTPRVTIDRVVVCRETWRCGASDIPFALIDSEAERFVAARRWASAHGMPRWVFIKAPFEDKPTYVDFESPLYINMFAKVVRRMGERGAANGTIVITEMLPTMDQLWLPDADDQRYTSEFRFVAVDRS